MPILCSGFPVDPLGYIRFGVRNHQRIVVLISVMGKHPLYRFNGVVGAVRCRAENVRMTGSINVLEFGPRLRRSVRSLLRLVK